MDVTRPILVAVDGSDASVRAAQLGAELACLKKGTLVLAYVEPPQQVPADYGAAASFDQQGAQGDVARKMLEDVRHRCEAHPTQVQLRVLQGDPAEAIARAGHDVDASMVVVGGCHRGAVSRALFGSVSNDLARLCVRPVLIVP